MTATLQAQLQTSFGQIVRQHIQRATALLPQFDADALLVFRRTNILAFCGVPLEPSDRLVCGLINRDGEIGLVLPAFESGVAEGAPAGTRLHPWEEHENSYGAVARAAADLGVTRGTILLDGFTWIETRERLAAALPGATFRMGSELIEAVRTVKTPEEVAAIRSACEATGRIYSLVGLRLRPGITEIELAREVLHQLRADDIQPYGELIQGGPNAAVPHRATSTRRFQNGDVVVVDFACTRDGYLGDMTRTFAVDGVTEEVRRAYAVVRQAQRAAIEAIRPGAGCESIDAVARQLIEQAGLGPYFVHRLGHGIGLDIHEPPYLVRGNTQRLEPGMCMTVEPGVYLPGRFGIRIEDVVAVTDDGCEILSSSVPTDVSDAFRAPLAAVGG